MKIDSPKKLSGSTTHMGSSSKTPTPPKSAKPSHIVDSRAGRTVKQSPEELKIAELERALAESKKNGSNLQRKVGRLEAALTAARQINDEAVDKVAVYEGTIQHFQKNNTLLFKRADYFERLAAEAMHNKEELEKHHKELVRNLQKEITDISTKHKAARGFIASLSPRYEADRIDWLTAQIKPIRPIGASPEKKASPSRTRANTILETPQNWQECQTLLMIGQNLLREYNEEFDLTIQAQIQAELQQILSLVHDYKPTLSDIPKEPPQRRPAFVLGALPQLRATDSAEITIKSPCRVPQEVLTFLYGKEAGYGKKEGFVWKLFKANTVEALAVFKQELLNFFAKNETEAAIALHEQFLTSFPSTTDIITAHQAFVAAEKIEDHANPLYKYAKHLNKYFLSIAETSSMTYELDLQGGLRRPQLDKTHQIIEQIAPKRVNFGRKALLDSLANSEHSFLDALQQQFDSSTEPCIDYTQLKKVFGDERKFSDLFLKNAMGVYSNIDVPGLSTCLSNADKALVCARKNKNFGILLTAFHAICTTMITKAEDDARQQKVLRKDKPAYDSALDSEITAAFDAWRKAKLTQPTNPMDTQTPLAPSLRGIFPTINDSVDHTADQALIHFVYGAQPNFASDLWQQFNDPSIHRLDLGRLEAFAKAHGGETLFERDPLNDLYANNKLNRFCNQVHTFKATHDFDGLMKSFNIFYRYALQVMLPSMQPDFLKDELNRAFHGWQTEQAHETHIVSAAKPLVHPIDSVENDHHEHHETTLSHAHGLHQNLKSEQDNTAS